MKARKKASEIEFELWNGSDEVFERIQTHTAIDYKASYKIHGPDGQETGHIVVPVIGGWQIAYLGAYVLFNPVQKERVLQSEEFLDAYEVIDETNKVTITMDHTDRSLQHGPAYYRNS